MLRLKGQTKSYISETHILVSKLNYGDLRDIAITRSF